MGARAGRWFPSVMTLAPMLLAGCAHTDTMTAVEHDLEAERHRSAAQQAEASVRTVEIAMPPQSGSEIEKTSGFSSAELPAGRASSEIADAERHEKAARIIRERANSACRRVPIAEQKSCPVPPGHVEPITLGARIVPAVSVPAELLRLHLECAMARAQVDRPPDQASCPLYAPGAAPRVTDRPQGAVIDITVDTRSELDDLVRRTSVLPAQ